MQALGEPRAPGGGLLAAGAIRSDQIASENPTTYTVQRERSVRDSLSGHSSYLCVCWMQVRCGAGASELVDVGRGRTDEEGALVLPVRFEATKRSQHAAASSVCDRGRPDSSVEARLAR